MTSYRAPQDLPPGWVHHDTAAGLLGITPGQLNELHRARKGPPFNQMKKNGVRTYLVADLDNFQRATRPGA